MNANKLEGYWDVTACEIGDDDLLEDMEMTFLFLAYSDGEGEVVWTWESLDGGPRSMGAIFKGEWSLNKEADEIEMDLAYNADMKVDITAEIDITKDDFDLEGDIRMTGSEKEDFVLKAKKRE